MDELSKLALNGDVNGLRLSIDSGMDVNSSDVSDRTVLIWAAIGGSVDCVRMLLDAGADVNHADKGGWTAVVGAAINGSMGCLLVLIDAGADIDVSVRDGKTASQLARGGGYHDVANLIDGLIASRREEDVLSKVVASVNECGSRGSFRVRL